MVSETRIAYGNVGGPAKDFLPLNSHTTVNFWVGDGKEFAFVVSSGAEELVLVANSEQERKEWMDAISSVSGSSGDPEVDKINDQLEAAKLAGEKAAMNAAKSSLPSASSMLPSMSSGHHTGGGLGGLASLGGALVGAAAAEATKAAAQAAEEASRLAKQAQAKLAMQTKLQSPIACSKKLNTESSYHDRFIWIKPDTKEFYWGKTEEMGKGKCIHIPTMVKAVSLDVAIVEPNFHIDLQNAESVLPAGVFSAAPTSIDITLNDSEVCAGFISYINELKAPNRSAEEVSAALDTASASLAGAAAQIGAATAKLPGAATTTATTEIKK